MMKGLEPFFEEVQRPYGIGDRVWIIEDQMVRSATVESITVEIAKPKDLTIMITAYKLQKDDSVDYYRALDVYPSVEKANEYNVFVPITDISDEEWIAAVGNFLLPLSYENSELGNEDDTRFVREILLCCRHDKGLMIRRVQDLRRALSEMRNSFSGPTPVLDKIFTQLGVENYANH